MEVGFCEFLEEICGFWLRFDADFGRLITKCYYWVRTDYTDYTDYTDFCCLNVVVTDSAAKKAEPTKDSAFQNNWRTLARCSPHLRTRLIASLHIIYTRFRAHP